MAMTATVRGLPAPGTTEHHERGSLAVSSMPMAILLQHQMIDQAENEVLAYRRLVSHLQVELAFVLSIPLKRNPPKNAARIDEYAGKIEAMGRRFRQRPNPYGTMPKFMPIGGSNDDRYELWMEGEEKSCIVHGADLPAAVEAMTTPFREWEFSEAGKPISDIHTEDHLYLDFFGYIEFASAFSNMAPEYDESRRQAGVAATKGILERRQELDEAIKAGEAERPKTEHRPKQPTNRDGMPRWVSDE
jgi:hypothetical protein